MKNFQEDKLSMYLKVKSICEKFQTVWTANSAFKATYDLFTEKITLIEQNRDIQIVNITGVTSDKAGKRQAMADKALYVANRLESFARVSSNAELLANIHFTSSTMERARDTDIVGICDLILEKAKLYKASLADYDVTEEDIKTLEESIATYTSVISKPQITKAQLKNATQNIAKGIKAADDLLSTRLDLDVEVFKTSKPDFYSQYHTARIVIPTGRQTVSLSVAVVDKDNNPVQNVHALITNIPKSNKSKDIINEISKKTGVKGLFRIINLVEGNYNVVFSKLGYVKQSQAFTVVNSETTKLRIVLQPESISSEELQ